MTVPSDAALIDDLTTIVSQAAAAILAARASALNTRTKADQSPVTAADDASEAIILEGVARLLPGVPIISEEASAARGRRRGRRRIHPGRSGRRHPRTGGRPRRIHDQSGAGAGGPPGARHRRRARARAGLAHRRRRRRASGFGSPPGAAAGRGHRDRRDPDPADAEGRHRRGGQPVPFRSGDRCIPGAAASATSRGWPADRRSSSAASPRARPTSIPAWRRPISGTWRPATPSWPPPAASSPPPDRHAAVLSPGADGLRVPGFIAWGDPSAVIAGR